MHTICIVLIPDDNGQHSGDTRSLYSVAEEFGDTMETEVMTIYLNRPYIKREISRCAWYKLVENYSLFVGINVYLPRIIVRIFVDFD